MSTARAFRPLLGVAAGLVLVAAAGAAPGARSADGAAPSGPGPRGGALRAFAAPPPVPAKVDSGTVLVKLRARGSERAVLADHGAAETRAVGKSGFVLARTNGRAPRAFAAELRRDTRVSAAVPNYVRRALGTPNDLLVQKGDPRFYLPTVRLPQAWDLGKGSASVVVAVIDTGVDADHPELAGRVVPGYDFVNDDADPADDHYHGTFVAGVIAAKPDNGAGIAGAAWDASIMPLKVLGADGSGTDADVATAITWATDHGADVINMSLGGPESSPVLKDAIDYAVAHDVVVVAAAGNEGSDEPHYPAAYPDVVAVGATDWAGNLTGFSSYGSWVDVAAPGDAIVGTYPAPGPEPEYAQASGTSFAAPIVAGIAALVRAKNPAWTQAQVVSQLLRTARDAGPQGVDLAYGHGIVDASAALGGAAAPALHPPAGDPREPDGTIARAKPMTDPYYEWATISPQTDVDWFSKSVTTAPSTLTFSVVGGLYEGNPEEHMIPVAQVYGPDLRPIGKPLVGASGALGLTVPVRTTGTYYLRVANYGGARSPRLNAGRPWGYTVQADSPSPTTVSRWNSDRTAIASGAYTDDPEATAIGDVTGDGRADVLLTTSTLTDASLRVYAQGPDGYLREPAVLPAVTAFNRGMGVDVGDLDGDGKNDAAVAADKLRVYYQRSGTLDTGTAVTPGILAKQVRIGDFDGDGRRDLATSWGGCGYSGGVTVYRNTPSGFARWTDLSADAQHGLRAADVNGDGRLDLVGLQNGCNGGANEIRVFRNSGGGAFASETISGFASDIAGFDVGDVTGDGRADIVVSTLNEIRIYAQNADGTLATPASVVANGSGAVAIGDVNGDGRRDILCASGVFLRNADGSWAGEAGIAPSYYFEPNRLSVGDVNGDGRLDAVAAETSWPGYLAVYRQASPSWPPKVWVKDTAPANFSEGAAASVAPAITFARALAATSVTSATVRLENRVGDAVAATPAYDPASQTVTVRPSAPLASGGYVVRVAGVQDTTGVAMPEETLRFTVGTSGDTTPPDTLLTYGPYGRYWDSMYWDFTSNEPGVTYQCTHDSVSWGECNVPWGWETEYDGTHTIQVRAVDAAGNADPTPATRTYTKPPANDAFAAPAALAGASGSATGVNSWGHKETGEPDHARDAGGMSVWYRWTAPSTGSYVFDTFGSTFDTTLGVYVGSALATLREVTSNDQALGTNWSRVSFAATAGTTYLLAVDGWHADGYPARGTFTLTWAPSDALAADTVPPTVQLTAPAKDAVVGGAVPITATAADDRAVARVDFFVDGVVVASDDTAPYSATWSTGTYTNTSHDVRARAVDAAGNFTWTPPVGVWVNNAAPDTYFDSGPGNDTKNGNATFTFHASKTPVTFECALDTGGWTACASPKTYAALPVGHHTFRVRAIDANGFVDSTPVTFGFDIFQPPPNDDFAAATPIAGVSGSATGTNVGATREEGEPVHYENGCCVSVWWRWTAPATGWVQFETSGSSFDTVLAAYSGSSVRGLTQLASNDDSNSRTSAIRFDATAGVTYSIAVDGYNRETGSIVLGWTSAAADTTDPTVSFTSPDAGAFVRGATAVVSVAAADNVGVARVEFLVGGTVVGTDTTAPYGLTWDTTKHADGPTTLVARAVDTAARSVTASRSFTVDNTAPVAPQIDSGPGGTVTSTSATFAFSLDESGITFQCSLDSASYVGCTAPVTYSGLAEGTHSFQVRATDAAGNFGAPAFRQWTVAPATAPNLMPNGSFASGLGGWTEYQATLSLVAGHDASQAARVLWSAGTGYSVQATPRPVSPTAAGTTYTAHAWIRSMAPGKSVCLRLREYGSGTTLLGSAQSCQVTSSSWQLLPAVTYTAVGGGSLDLYAYQTSAAAGDSFDLDEVVLQAGSSPPPPPGDTTPPETTIDSGPSGTTTQTSATFAFSASEAGGTFECSLDAAAWAACSTPKSYTGLPAASHTFRVRAKDAAGNVDPTPAEQTWTVTASPSGTPSNYLPNGSFANGLAGWATYQSALSLVAGHDATQAARVTLATGTAYSIEAEPRPVPTTVAGRSYSASAWVRAAAPGKTVCLRVREYQGATQVGAAQTCAPTSAGWAELPALVYSAVGGGSLDVYAYQSNAVAGDSFEIDEVLVRDASATPPPPPPGDTTPPETTVDSGPTGTSTSSTATFTFSANESGATFQCRLDAGPWTACTSPKDYTGLANGAHSFGVKATDAAGNADATPAERTWTVAVPAGPASLIANGGFESGLDGWGGYQAALSLVAGASSPNAARVTISTGTAYSIETATRPVAATTAGTVYTAQAWIRAQVGGKTICLRIREWQNGAVAGSNRVCATVTTTWTQLPAVTYTALGGGSLDLYAYQGTAATGDSFDIDGVTLTTS
jgi:type VII secretion-associated serine protease mycosin